MMQGVNHGFEPGSGVVDAKSVSLQARPKNCKNPSAEAGFRRLLDFMRLEL